MDVKDIEKVVRDNGLTLAEKAILVNVLVSNENEVTASKLIRETGLAFTTVYRALDSLHRKGFLRVVKEGRGRNPRVYALAK